ncbi:S8 family peptidase [Microbacterium sp. P26]|uniref:S8 family serine peptidase n=1 Tax=Microbacterium algihabitans TaxID=3075992 RepID=UPI003F803D24|nr:S8 family peptidase [Microbacterium sp. P26]
MTLALWPPADDAIPAVAAAADAPTPTASETPDPAASAEGTGIAAADEWIHAVDLPADATDDDRLQAKLAYDLITVPLSQRDALLSLPGVDTVAPIVRDDALSVAVLREQSDIVRASIPDAVVEPNQVAKVDADQTPVPSWGLDSVDNAGGVQDGHYRYDNDGAGTTVFVMDSGVQSDHPDFGGRVDAAAGKDFINDGRGTEDCLGHGTHVAGTVGSTTYGVAKKTRIIPVRVFGCSETGSAMDVYYALNWITDNNRWPDRMVINMSLSVPKYFPINNTASFANSRGFVVVAAAGNESEDACNSSPGSTSSVITVGYYTKALNYSVYSNYGSCVKVVAPGGDITSTYVNGGTATASGTSMAAPHVAGLAARLLQAHPSWFGSDVLASFKTAASTGRLGNMPANTVNVIATIPVAAAQPQVTSLTTSAASGGMGLSWTTNGVGTFTAFAITVTDTTTGIAYPVTVSGSKSSTVFTNVIAGHAYSITIIGTATVSSGASVTTDPVTATGP